VREMVYFWQKLSKLVATLIKGEILAVNHRLLQPDYNAILQHTRENKPGQDLHIVCIKFIKF
jgi:hypothetical protein